jgi:hypothetical protein
LRTGCWEIIGPKRDKVMGDWRKLHNEQLHDLYSSPSVIRMMKRGRMKWVGHVKRMGKKMNANSILVGKSEAKRPLGRYRHRREDNIKMDLREKEWCFMD